jgi:hypothetical protein
MLIRVCQWRVARLSFPPPCVSLSRAGGTLGIRLGALVPTCSYVNAVMDDSPEPSNTGNTLVDVYRLRPGNVYTH